ncbi:L-2,4-diaminobutyric acid acetyltransferase [Paenibacillus sp. 1_12]|uniref:GNAT family N-acetyltransferase n=1 Tax=Paenibacillus sp. 1_12 TaxID=1566278 RepID=UPI0008E444AE|nr:GNAT family N-acetyltransferase [Paenibacillus sp. 1_12]SFL55199.1 L-2,4-diaminobutyric acid acetyltransferase [Paenibacillus sp. 1_12]
MDIRSICKGDASRILRFVEQCGPYVVAHNLYVYWMLENYYASTCKVVEIDNEIIGFVSGMPSADKLSLFIWQICIHQDYRNQGIATLLLDSSIFSAREKGYQFMDLTISKGNMASQMFFEKYVQTKQISIVEKLEQNIGDSTEIIFKYRL